MTRITKIAARNFRSFGDIEVDLEPLEVVIGPNAAGKSNLVEVVRFLSDITREGFDNAVSLHGGPEFIPNASAPDEETVLSITVEHDPPSAGWALPSEDPLESECAAMATREELVVTFISDPAEGSARLLDSVLRVHAKHTARRRGRHPEGAPEVLGSFIVDIAPSREEPVALVDTSSPDLICSEELVESLYVFAYPRSRDEVPVEGLGAEILPIGRFLRDVRFYQFDPRTIERAVKRGPADLEPDASNLPIVLKRLLRDEESRGKLLRLLKRLLPFLQELDVVRQADQSLLIEYIENFAPSRSLPAFLMSGGTRNLTAMIVALYFEDSSLTIIEEPEANVHPMLISRICEMFVEASTDRQIMVTTHNPEILRYVPMDNVLVVSRDADGFSRAERVRDRPGVAEFIEQELGVSDLQLMGLLGGAR